MSCFCDPDSQLVRPPPFPDPHQPLSPGHRVPGGGGEAVLPVQGQAAPGGLGDTGGPGQPHPETSLARALRCSPLSVLRKVHCGRVPSVSVPRSLCAARPPLRQPAPGGRRWRGPGPGRGPGAGGGRHPGAPRGTPAGARAAPAHPARNWQSVAARGSDHEIVTRRLHGRPARPREQLCACGRLKHTICFSSSADCKRASCILVPSMIPCD